VSDLFIAQSQSPVTVGGTEPETETETGAQVILHTICARSPADRRK